MQGQICKAIPACTEGAILYIVDETVSVEGRIVFDYEKCKPVASASWNAAGVP